MAAGDAPGFRVQANHGHGVDRPLLTYPNNPLAMLNVRLQLVASVFVLGLAHSLPAQSTNLPSQAPYYRVEYPASSTAGELIYGVSYTVWLPPGVETLRGVIVHQHGCGDGACKGGLTAAYDLHWQALAAKHACALLGPSYQQPEGADCGMWCDPRNGSDARFRQALTDLGKMSGHEELSEVPWALWGHSGGGVWAGTMLVLHPQRVAAVWLRSGTPRMMAEPNSKLPSMDFPAAALEVPVMCNLGTQEGVTVTDGRFSGVWPKNKAFFEDVRSHGGLIGVAVDPHSSHDCGNSRYLAITWLDACLAARLPAPGEQGLRPMPSGAAWTAALLSADAVPANEFTGDRPSSIWLPNERVAKAYSQYVSSGEVEDASPPPAPAAVEQKGNELTWSAVADFESGIGSFVIERDGVVVGRVPSQATGNVGRKVFQVTSYHDTPSQPLAQMRFTISEQPDSSGAIYSVRTVNSVGLVSPATPAERR